jgi:CheY-like chemotaxis protein
VGKRVLIVDDEPFIRKLVSTALGRSGYEVVEAADGPAGLSVVHADSGIELVILDLTLPGMSGLEVLRGIRRIQPTLPVVLSSGALVDDLEGRLGDHVRVLAKPYRPSELREVAFGLTAHALRA